MRKQKCRTVKLWSL